MILIVENGEKEKNVLGDLRRVRTAKFGYRLPSKTYSLVSARPPPRVGEQKGRNAPTRVLFQFNSP